MMPPILSRAIAPFLALIFCGALAPDVRAQTSSESSDAASASRVESEVRQIRAGTPIEVRFANGSKSRGYLSDVEADGFSFKTGDPVNGDLHRTAFAAVKSVKPKKPTHTAVAAWIAAGAIVGAVVVVLVAYLKFRSNE